MTKLVLPDDTQCSFSGFVNRLLPDVALSGYDRPYSINPVLHRSLLSMHLHFAFEYVHKHVSSELLKSITMKSGLPVPYLLFAFENELKDRYQTLYGCQPVYVESANALAEPVVRSLHAICGKVATSHFSIKTSNRALPPNKPLNLVSTLEQTDYIEACYLRNQYAYKRTDELSLLHDPHIGALWSIGDYLSTQDPNSLVLAVTQLTSGSSILDTSSSLAEDISKAVINPRMLTHVPVEFHPLIEVSKFFKEPIGNGWIEYLQKMTPLFDDACASRVELIKNVFYSPHFPISNCVFECPTISSNLTHSFPKTPNTFVEREIDVKRLPIRQPSLKTYIFYQDITYYECA